MAKRGPKPKIAVEQAKENDMPPKDSEQTPTPATTVQQAPPQAPKPSEPKLEPLTPEEEAELAELEKRARNGRSQLQPSAPEMLRLGKLRARAKAR